jgi:eukaryotic-like serine/threonine-protein kinase
MMHASDGFQGTSRFVVEGRLGAGGMGVVYRVRDVERGEVVALKTMARAQPSTLLRFKREFRALADITHPNVVQLYELFSEDDRWFFTMELVEGNDLLTWVAASRSMPPPPMHATALSSGAASTMLAPLELADGRWAGAVTPELDPPSSRREPSAFALRDVDRLRAALSQLAAGLSAIHAVGKLHRDIKPSNVMVTRSGRVVLLDFGIVTEVTATRGREEEPLAGTPAYMAPERSATEPSTPASDWYAVGVILYEALTGRLPFEGFPISVLYAKRQRPPPPPSSYVEGVPEDLERLAMDLLERDPRARPTGPEVLARLSHPSERRSAESVTSMRPPFVGRRAELSELHAAFDASATGLSVVMLHGPSGIGKSAVVSRFLGELAEGRDVLVLSGRCYEREAVPFKAVDAIVDELRRWLGALPEGEGAGYLPADLDALARVFPVLGDLGSLATPRHGDTGEPGEVRRRAFAALEGLLSAIARRHRLVVHVDDLQWCDADSVQLLDALFAAPPWPWLFVCSYRSELAAESRPLADLRALIVRSRAIYRDVAIGELSESEAEELARELVGAGDADTARRVTREARGNPLFVAELARWAKERAGDDAGDEAITLERLILERVMRLPDEARRLVEVLSVARGPLAHGVATTAASLPPNKRGPALLLRSARLVSMRGLDDDDPIELAHDRLRETVAQSLVEARRRACHAGIARALAARESPDHEAIFEHFRTAGETDQARAWALPAARAADRALAFWRAAELYAAAIELGAVPDAGADRDDAGSLHRRLGDALLHAGEVARAAEAYHEGAERAQGSGRRDLLRRAAENYLKSGRDARGVSVLRTVLAEVGLTYPESPTRAVAEILWHEAALRASPLRRRLRAEVSVRRSDLERIDATFSAATGLALSDPVRGASFAARGLSLALAAGEPLRLCRALAVAASNMATRGEPGRARAEALVGEAERVAHETGEPHAVGLALFAAGAVHFCLGEWRTAGSSLARAERTFAGGCRGVAWELANTRSWICNVLILSGEIAEASRLVPPLIDEARARDDRFFSSQLVYPAVVAALVGDDVPSARAAVDLGVARSGGQRNAGQWGAFISACSVDRYGGDGAQAFSRVQAEWPWLERSPLMRASMVRVFTAYEAGLSAIASAEVGVDRRRALRAASRWARGLARGTLRFAPALGLLVEAGVCAARGDTRRASRALGEAIPRLDQADLGYLAACARYRHGQLLGGAQGRELIERAGAFFATHGVRRVDRCLSMSSPGFARLVGSL